MWLICVVQSLLLD